MLDHALRARRILLADDDEQLQDLVRYTADRLGHQVLCVTRGQDVTSAAREAQPDIVVLDLGFPDADGRDLLQQLKRDPSTAQIPVVVWSGRTGHSSDSRISLDLGAEDYVVKDDPILLFGKVDRVLLRVEQAKRRTGA